MTRRLARAAYLLAAIAVLAILADAASAQGGGRGRGGRGFGRGFRAFHQVELATLPEVQADLKLTDEQKTKVVELSDAFREERRGQGGRGGGGGGFSPEAREAQAKLNADFAGKLNEVLDDAQDARILGIFAQVNGTSALTDAAVAAALALSDDDQKKLAAVADEQRQAMRDSFQDSQDLSDDERMAKFDELNKARDAALLAALTDDQRAKFEALKGDKLEVDTSSLQGRGGRGGRGGDGGGRGRGGQRPPADDDSAN
jgi:Spy/CpxP family protein refolding chaperone